MKIPQQITTNPADKTSADWQARFRAPTIFSAKFAEHAPERGLVAGNHDGSAQLYRWDVETGALQRLTDLPDGLFMGQLSPDGQYVYYFQDKYGAEIGHYVRVPYNGGEVENLTPDLPPYPQLYLDFTRSGNQVMIGLVDEESRESYYAITLSPDGRLGERRLIYQSNYMNEDCCLTPCGNLAVISTNQLSQSLHLNLVAVETATGEVIAELWDGPGTSIQPGFFSPIAGDHRLIATTTKRGYRRPFLWNPVTNNRFDLPLDSLPGEITPEAWAPDGHTILLRQFFKAKQRLFRYDLRTHNATALGHPAGSYGALQFRANGELFAHWQDSQTPSCIIRLASETGHKLGVALAAGRVPAGQKLRSIQFPSLDGALIQGWLATPEGAGPFPTIIETHGGPDAAVTEAFNPFAQSWLDHGFAYLSVNYRGSTGFGQAYQDKIVGRPGHWEVEDMVGARQWLIQEEIAHPQQIFLTGWSYGGYLTLQAMGQYPGLWAGGIAGAAIADWQMTYEDCMDTLRIFHVGLFGGTPEELPTTHAAASPITYAAQVDAPILVIQGKNDSRTPARQLAAYEAKLRALGKSIEVVWYESGHMGAFAGVEQAIGHQARMLAFAQQVLQHKISQDIHRVRVFA